MNKYLKQINCFAKTETLIVENALKEDHVDVSFQNWEKLPKDTILKITYICHLSPWMAYSRVKVTK